MVVFSMQLVRYGQFVAIKKPGDQRGYSRICLATFPGQAWRVSQKHGTHELNWDDLRFSFREIPSTRNFITSIPEIACDTMRTHNLSA